MVGNLKDFVVFCASPCDDAHVQQAIEYCKNNGLTHKEAKIIKMHDCVIVKIKNNA